MDFSGADLRMGVQGIVTPLPPSGQRQITICTTTDVLSHADEMIYIAMIEVGGSNGTSCKTTLD